jgi:hypothetical protein
MANLSFRVYAKHSDTCDCTPTNRCAFYRSEWDITAVFRYLLEAIDYAQYCNRNRVSVEIRNRAWGSPGDWIISEYPAERRVQKMRRHGVAEAIAACDDIEVALSRIRGLLKSADTYRREALYQALERTWIGFASILENLPNE